MLTFKEFVNEAVSQEELGKRNIFIDSSRNQWPSEMGSIDSYAKKRGYKQSVGFFANKSASFMDRFLYELTPEDTKWLKSIGASVTKSDEVILRMISSKHVAANMLGLIKINLVKGNVYFFDEEKESFETRSEKVQYARFVNEYYKRHVRFV